MRLESGDTIVVHPRRINCRDPSKEGKLCLLKMAITLISSALACPPPCLSSHLPVELC